MSGRGKGGMGLGANMPRTLEEYIKKYGKRDGKNAYKDEYPDEYDEILRERRKAKKAEKAAASIATPSQTTQPQISLESHMIVGGGGVEYASHYADIPVDVEDDEDMPVLALAPQRKRPIKDPEDEPLSALLPKKKIKKTRTEASQVIKMNKQPMKRPTMSLNVPRLG
jgi:hypothetical protein